MKKIFLIFLCLIATAIIAAPPGHYGPYDPGAIRSDGTNASDTVTLNRVRTATGTAAAPAYSFSTDPDTGIYSPGANVLGFGVGGADVASLSSTGLSLGTPLSVANGGTGATTAAEGLAALGGASLNGSSTVDFSVNHVKAGDGTAAAPAFSFASDPDTGIYRNSENTLALTASGAVGLYTSGGNTAIGPLPSTNNRLRIFAFPENVDALDLTGPDPAVTVSGTNYKRGLTVNDFRGNIATGVVDSGYRMGISVESFMRSADFQGTLADNFGAKISTGIYSGTGTISNCYSLYLKNYNLSGTITNNWGIYQDTAAARNYFAGRSLFGTTTDDGVSAVQVNGNIKADKILAATGTAAAPAYTFSSDPDTGIYSPSANALGFGVNGAESMRIASGGNVLIATSTDDGSNKLQVNGFTKLGEAATGIKMKVLTGTTAEAEGGYTSVAHGLSSDKIISWRVQVNHTTGEYIGEAYPDAGYQYKTVLIASYVNVLLSETESENILNKPLKVLIWYIE